jgi:hypothetical protein
MRPWAALLLLVACKDPDPADTDGADTDVESDADTDADTDSDTDSDTDTDTAPSEPELWMYVRHNLQVDDNVTEVKALIDRGAAAGYHGVVIADFKLNLLHTGNLADWYDDNLAEVLAHAEANGMEVVPAIFPFGYSEGILYEHPDWAEGMPVEGATFRVQPDGTLALEPSYSGPANGGFEDHDGDTFVGWSWQDDPGVRTFADTAVTHSGGVSARIDPGSGNARIVQGVVLEPWRQYHLSYWIRTDGFSGGYVQVVVLDASTGAPRNHDSVAVETTQGWTRYDVAFDSMDSTSVNLYAGVWGGFSSGSFWIDDVSLEETALVNLIRRDGAPLVVRDDAGNALTEGADFDPIADPAILTGFDDWHEPPVVTSSLPAGDLVTIDHYVVAPVYGFQVGACLTEPGIQDWMRENMAAVAAAFPDSTGIFLGYDEMRHMNTCDSCRAEGLEAGELLAWHVGEAAAIVEVEKPGAQLYFWSDMFDPHHNAHDDYYMVEGDLAGSWDGLPEDAIVMNWNLGSHDSLAFLAGEGHAQIIAGYYDSGDGAASANAELDAISGVPDVRGMMYTTWTEDWSQLEAYAEAARSRW